MVEIVEVKDWAGERASLIIDVKNLEELKKIADGYKAPFILKKDKEYRLYPGPLLLLATYFRFKE